MGNVRLITGRSGSGKTNRCIEEFVLSQNKYRKIDGRNDSFLIVPEQFSVDYERKVLRHPDCKGLLGSEVISFNRLSHRLVTDQGIIDKTPIDASGKAMILVDVMRSLDLDEKLSYYKKCAGNPACVAGLLETITEFSKYCVSYDTLFEISNESGDNDLLKQKFYEIALIYSEYQKKFSEKYSDSSFYIKSAAALIKEAKVDISGFRIWVDGFSGFTEEEMLLLDAFADNASQLTLCLFHDNNNNLIFSCPDKTYSEIYRRFVSKGHSVEVIDLNTEKGERRFSENSGLEYLEKYYGRVGKAKETPVKCDDIELFSCRDLYQEAENCAAKISELVKSGYSLKDIAVVSSDLEKNSAVFRAVFARLNIPLFIDIKQDVSGHPVVRCAIAFLDILANGVTRESIFTMLKTGLYKADIFDGNDVCRLENIVLSYGVSSSSNWKKMCVKLNNSYKDKKFIPREVVLANDITEVIFGENGFLEQMKSISSVADCCKVLVSFFESIGLEKSVTDYSNILRENGYMDASETYVRVWNIFASVLGDAEKVAGHIKINGYKKLSGYVADLLRAALSSQKAGFIPFTENCVQVGNIERSRYIDKKVVFIIGANEGVFPKSFTESGVLSDKERVLLKDKGASLAYSSGERTLFAQFNVYSVLVSASEKLFLSYSHSNSSDSDLFPAPAVASLQRLFPGIEIVPVKSSFEKSKLDMVREVIPDELSGNYYSPVTIDKELVKKLLDLGVETKLSVSRLENYRSCPYKNYLQYVLSLSERENGEIRNNYIGTYFHGIVESVTRMLMSGDEKDKEDFDAIVKKASEEFLSEADNEDLKFLLENSFKNSFMKERVESFAAYDLENIAAISESTGFSVWGSEVKFGYDDDESLETVRIPCDEGHILLLGKIDRIDVRDRNGKREVCVVDYKKKSDYYILYESDVLEGLKLQLITYLLAVDNNKERFATNGEEVIPSAIMYYLYDKNVKAKQSHEYNGLCIPEAVDPEMRLVKPSDLGELSRRSVETIKSIYKGIASGCFDVNPVKSGDPCKICSGGNICRYKTFAVDDGNET